MNVTTPVPALNPARLRLTLGGDYLAANFGRFTLMPVLAMLLASQGGGASWVTTGIGLFGFTLCAGMSSLLVNPWLPRLPYRVSLPVSMACSALGFGLLPYTADPVATMALLFLAGFGISVHAVLSRVLIAEVYTSETARNNIYSMQQICTNAAAALGPFIAAALYVSGDGRPLLLYVGLTYVLAGIALLAGLPGTVRPPETVRERASGLASGVALLRDAQCRRITVSTALGAFVYAQFYSAFALLVALGVGSTLLRGALLAAPAVVIVVLQALVTTLANRRLRAGVPAARLLALAVLLFGVAVLPLGLGLPVLTGAIAAMALFPVAEMLFTPLVSTAFNGVCGVPALAASNLQQVAWTAGEALGSLCGGAVFLLCYSHGVGGRYWLLLALAAIGGAVPLLNPRRISPKRTEDDAEGRAAERSPA